MRKISVVEMALVCAGLMLLGQSAEAAQSQSMSNVQTPEYYYQELRKILIKRKNDPYIKQNLADLSPRHAFCQGRQAPLWYLRNNGIYGNDPCHFLFFSKADSNKTFSVLYGNGHMAQPTECDLMRTRRDAAWICPVDILPKNSKDPDTIVLMDWPFEGNSNRDASKNPFQKPPFLKTLKTPIMVVLKKETVKGAKQEFADNEFRGFKDHDDCWKKDHEDLYKTEDNQICGDANYYVKMHITPPQYQWDWKRIRFLTGRAISAGLLTGLAALAYLRGWFRH